MCRLVSQGERVLASPTFVHEWRHVLPLVPHRVVEMRDACFITQPARYYHRSRPSRRGSETFSGQRLSCICQLEEWACPRGHPGVTAPGPPGIKPGLLTGVRSAQHRNTVTKQRSHTQRVQRATASSKQWQHTEQGRAKAKACGEIQSSEIQSSHTEELQTPLIWGTPASSRPGDQRDRSKSQLPVDALPWLGAPAPPTMVQHAAPASAGSHTHYCTPHITLPGPSSSQ